MTRPTPYTTAIATMIAALVTASVSGCTPTAEPSVPTTPSGQETMVVTSTADGDTFTGRDATGTKVKIRLLGIDAPETAHDGQPAACGGNAAAARLHELLLGKTVRLVKDAKSDDVDRYQRRLRYVELDGRDLALVLLSEGLAEAWYPSSEPRPQRYPAYAAAERSARDSRVGSWQTCDKLGR
jgi:endonuclease YncB( thermonuclease family)